MLVHLSLYEVAVRSVVAGVEVSKPLPLSIGGDSTSNLVCVCPDKLGVVAVACCKLERLDLLSAEKCDFIVPICDALLPIEVAETKALLGDV